MTKLRIFLADDHGVFREALRALLDAQPDMQVVGEAGTGLDAIQFITELRPDVAIIDLSLPGLNGAQVVQRLRRSGLEVKVITLTVHEDTAYLRLMLEAGVAGYVPKRAPAVDLFAAIRHVASGGIYVDPAVARKVVTGFVGRHSSESESGSVLSEREVEVARFVAEGYSNKEIASRLKLSVKTVESHKRRIMEKLGFQSRVQLIRYALDCGWL
jgi:DNA-binding NarL/FixJ family response regulator